tara:strand:- start:93 stop:332 length:240 start_codon:yes stop_codon:yes gene_type:complete
MEYTTEVNVRDLGIDTEDLISLAEDNGDELMYKEEMLELVAEASANAVNLDALDMFITATLREAATEISRAIRSGDYSA